MRKYFSSLEYLEVPESSLYPKPGAPESKVFKHIRKKSTVNIVVSTSNKPPVIEVTPKKTAKRTPKSKAEADLATPGEIVKRKRGRPRKVIILPREPNPPSRLPTTEPEVIKELIEEPVKVVGPPSLKIDEKGEAKIAPDGSLLDGREFAIRKFFLPSRPGQYFLMVPPLYRHLGLTDRRYVERSFPMLPILESTFKDQEELLKTGVIRASRKHFRSGVIPAREAFMVLGHLIVENGVPGKDDYYEDPEDSLSKDFILKMASKESDASDASASEEDAEVSQRSFQYKMSSELLPSEEELGSWMAQSAHSFNSQLAAFRRANSHFYDPHTNQHLYPCRAGHPNRDICSVDDALLECLSPDLRATILTLKQSKVEPAKPARSNLYPLALNETQIQANIPIHSSRFGQQLNENDFNFLASAARYSGPAVETGFNAMSPTFARPPPKPIHGIRAVSFKAGHEQRADANGKITCGFPRANGSGPCIVQVSHIGKRCRFHRGEASVAADSPEDYGEAGDSNLCIFCNTTLAPVAALELNGGVKHTPENGRRRRIARSETITCAECHNSCHLWCIQITDAHILDQMRSYDWVCNDCKKCTTCESPEDEETLLFCDGCDRAFHMACLDPPIHQIPEGGWKCTICE